MGLRQDLVLRVRWNVNRAVYVARTEGIAVLAVRTAARAGIARSQVEPEEVLVGPPRAPLKAQSAAAWPLSLLVVAGPARADRAAHLMAYAREAGIPALQAPPGAPPAQQLVSRVIVVGPDALTPGLLAEAGRLRQRVVLDVAADDLSSVSLPAALERCDAVTAASAVAGAEHAVVVADTEQLRQVLAVTG